MTEDAHTDVRAGDTARSRRRLKAAYRVIACLAVVLFAGTFYASCRSLLSVQVGRAPFVVGMVRDPSFLPYGPAATEMNRSWALSYRSARSAYVIGVAILPVR